MSNIRGMGISSPSGVMKKYVPRPHSEWQLVRILGLPSSFSRKRETGVTRSAG